MVILEKMSKLVIHEFILRCILYFRLVHCIKKNNRNNNKNEIGLRCSRRQNWSLFKLKKARLLKIKHPNIVRSFHLRVFLDFIGISSYPEGASKVEFCFSNAITFLWQRLRFSRTNNNSPTISGKPVNF